MALCKCFIPEIDDGISVTKNFLDNSQILYRMPEWRLITSLKRGRIVVGFGFGLGGVFF